MIPSTLEEARPLVQDFPGLDDYGTYNKAPEPMTRITAREFVAQLIHWPIVAVEHRQVCDLHYRPLKIFWLSTRNAVAICTTWMSGPSRWEPEFWLIGCEHRHMVETKPKPGPPACTHTHRCPDCGWEITYDSSG